MSLISKALKKTQESRQKLQDDKVENIVYLTEKPSGVFNTVLMVLLVLGVVTAIVMSISAMTTAGINGESKQQTESSLQRTISIQQRQINDLIKYLNKAKNLSNSQMRVLNLRLKAETEDRKTQFGSLASTENLHYESLKEAVLDDKRQIDFIDKNEQAADQKIDAMRAASTQNNSTP